MFRSPGANKRDKLTSYLRLISVCSSEQTGTMGDKKSVDVKLIPEYSGEGCVLEWLDKAEMVCEMEEVTNVARVLPMRLTGGAYAVYKQLPPEKRSKLADIKKALIAAFSANQFTAYDQFTERKMRPGECPDVYLANLRAMAELFGGVSDKTLVCAFVKGLPDGVKQALRTGACMENIKIEAALTKARAVLADASVEVVCSVTTPNAAERKEEKNETALVGGDESCAAAVSGGRGGGVRRGAQIMCYNCGRPNHLAKHCRAGNKRENTMRCFKCDQVGHVAARCPGSKSEQQAGNE